MMVAGGKRQTRRDSRARHPACAALVHNYDGTSRTAVLHKTVQMPFSRRTMFVVTKDMNLSPRRLRLGSDRTCQSHQCHWILMCILCAISLVSRAHTSLHSERWYPCCYVLHEMYAFKEQILVTLTSA